MASSSVLVLGFESADHPVQGQAERALAIALELGGTFERGVTTAAEGDASERWRTSFLNGPYLQDAMIRLGVVADTFETACTWTTFPTLYAQVRAGVEAAPRR